MVRGDGAGRDVMRSAEGGQKVVKRVLIRQIHYGEPGAPFVPVGIENVVISYRDVEKIARSDARRIVIVIFRARCGNASRRVEVYCEAGQVPVGLIGVVGVACTPAQESPASNC